jgi:predicted transcriptional regulator
MMPMHSGSGPTGGSAAGCDCPTPAQATTAIPRADPLPRTAGGSESSPCSGSANPVYSGIASTTGRFSGIRRIYPKNVLDHPERAVVYTTIVARPGIDLSGIASELGMNRETLRYHLDQLESATKVVVMRNRGIVRYYENHGRYSLPERKALQHFWNPTAERILSFIATRPGINQNEVAVHLSVTAPTVRWYMNRFRHDGLITEQHDGRYTRYSLTPEAIPFIRHTVPGNSDTIAVV